MNVSSVPNTKEREIKQLKIEIARFEEERHALSLLIKYRLEDIAGLEKQG